MTSIFDSSEMIGAFLDEAEEQLQLLEDSIMELERNGDTPETIQKIFRVAHTLKGSSSAMRFEKMKQLTHEMENVLDKIRNNKLKVSRQVVDTLFQGADYLRQLKDDFVLDQKNINTDITCIVNALGQLHTGHTEEEEVNTADWSGDQIKNDMNTVYHFNLDEEQKQLIGKASESGMFPLILTVKILEESAMKATRALLILNYLNEISTVIDTLPNVLELPDDTEVQEISYLILSEMDPKALEAKALVEIMDIESLKISPYQLNHYKGQDVIAKSSTQSNNDKTAPAPKVNQTVRVDVDRLDSMMNLVGELVIEQTRIAQIGNTLKNQYASDGSVGDLVGVSGHLSRVISELQEGVMKARMLPLQQLFNRFPRMVRDLSQALNKDIDLILEGGETEMDRKIIEDINDPLIHIIRNSIDHGIEAPEERIKNGKSPKGTIRINAFHQENHIILTIEDDGAGMDANKIKASAVKKEIISQQEADSLPDHDAINLIFHPGFSTAQTISDVSGRGVGMEIVRNHIDKLNGIIDIETEPGKGTRFILKLPLTLAILTGLLVKINEETYAIPMNNVLEIVRKPESEIEAIKGQAVAVIRDKVHPLVWLHDYFHIPRQRRGKNVFIVVLGVAEKRIGLVVDELIGNQEIVVKTLGAFIGKVEIFSGATILGDGSVACILDVVGIAKMVSVHKALENIEGNEAVVEGLNH